MSEQLIIIPNEELISDGVWSTNLMADERHGQKIYEYSLKHQLGLNFETVGIDENNFNGHLWGIALAKLGHVSLHSDKNENIIIYLPDIITEGQYKFFRKYHGFVAHFHKISTCVLKLEDGNYIIDTTKKIPNSMDHNSSVKMFYRCLKDKYKEDNNRVKILSK